MTDDVQVQMMTEQLILWRCLHGGPISFENIETRPSDSPLDLESYQKRNVPLLMKLTRTYGACAVLAVQSDRIVGFLRFYPKTIWNMEEAGYLCLQQDYPAGPQNSLAASVNFPSLPDITDRTLKVHCMMTGSAQEKETPFLRKGLGTRMVKCLIPWANNRGWSGIEAESFENIPIIYEITGSAGHSFWEKLGFYLKDRHPHPDLQGSDPFVETLEAQAKAMNIPPERARDRLIMRLDLK